MVAVTEEPRVLNTEQSISDEDIPSLIEIKKALPDHVFRSSLKKSLYFVAKDLLIVALLLVFEATLCRKYPVLYPVYWMAQGTMFWAVFVLGHDCGHSSFSNSTLINDIFGTILHTGILVPYYSWKLSHRAHHKNTGNMDRDEVFYPVKESIVPEAKVPFFEHVYFGLGLSWFYYLALGYKPRPACHFNPSDGLFKGKFLDVSVTLGAYCAWVAALLVMTLRCGIVPMFNAYFAPVLVFATWLVAVTFLHHNDVGVEWYSDSNWNYVKGNLSSVDRDYGWLHTVTHNIGTHQIHHLFPIIPHYNLEEATAAFRKAFPHLVRINNEPVISEFIKQFKIFARQHVIPDYVETFSYVDEKRK
mmetsp:Transcript_6983/g.21258  ORF Transcript_6983/g.21258 Transcript_6983/m.21258 type:complete len:359 (-) Transcript_6983:101-1177(-)|eukprot:CAMPEP_0198733946 /NCGR_PEP_ID=MMETSP1475-20131203/49342_1 /TAXON_ID= ORGANISM="Unidentified sp., Strain CCMP1999" /NCGR_SAMPLE_ID=MMETSP1475 /ASSEMBLY_ACC=CAM_ASM_001111 /LENGTH=358 /DNA_ID=CAMNT_0044497327 /DNA_START=364 /DNA_END=1440 /DNA_ORIENTATION=-